MTYLAWLRRFREKWQLTIVSVALIAVAVIGFAQDQANDDARFRDTARVNRQLREADINRDFKSCGDTREFRRTFSEFLDQSARPSSAGVNFSQLRSFADLDPATKAFLEELGAVQSGGNSTLQTIAERYRERFFPLPDCRKNRDEALARLPD